MRKLMIAPSVGCCDLFHVEEQVKLINEKSDYLHMDIKDGVYVPSYGIGPDYLDYLNKHVENLKPMDAHLMVKHPQQYLETFAKAGAAYITPHTDCIEGDAFVTIHKIKELGCKAGVALSPSVPLSTIEYYLPLLDKVTIMIVDPGIAGQPSTHFHPPLPPLHQSFLAGKQLPFPGGYPLPGLSHQALCRTGQITLCPRRPAGAFVPYRQISSEKSAKSRIIPEFMVDFSIELSYDIRVI